MSDSLARTSEEAAGDRSQEEAQADAAGPEHSLAVLGMVAFLEMASFSRLAGDASLAPSLAQRLELSSMARHSLDRMDRVGRRVVELGGELEPVMAPYAGVLVEFDSRTVPSTWWERLLKAYVGYGVADDFCRLLARTADARTRAVVEEVLDDEGHARLVVATLASAAISDPTLASRLALWGRRLVGEALGAVQGVLSRHPLMRELLAQALADEAPGDPQQRLFSLLTAEHSRRMDRLGLAP
jgi:hypothetical protein